MKKVLRASSFLVVGTSILTMFGCANYEVNTGRGKIPGHYIRYEMQESDRAVEAARQAGKDKTCPAEFKAAEAARNNAYDVFRACNTEEGAALAKKATAMANALCPSVAANLSGSATGGPANGLCNSPSVAGIRFETNKSRLKAKYHKMLDEVGKFMKEHPNSKGTIEGHTDSRGSKKGNLKLSQARAESVRNYIIKKFGIDADRLSAKGFGSSKPVATNKNASGRAKNRRIEAVFICE